MTPIETLVPTNQRRIIVSDSFHTVATTHPILKDHIKSLLVGLFENDYSPWFLSVDSYKFAEGLSNKDFLEGGSQTEQEHYFHPSQLVPLAEGCSIVLKVENPNSGVPFLLVEVGPAELKKGLDLLAVKRPDILLDILEDSDDANACDIFGQLVVYGEIVYD